MEEAKKQYELSSAETLFKKSFALFEAKFKTLLGIILISVVIQTPLLSKGMIPSDRPFLFLVVSLTTIFFSLWSSLALFYVIVGNKEGVGLKEAYRRSLRKIHSYFWISILVGGYLLGGFTLFLIPVIIFLIWFNFCFFILISENLVGIDTLMKSRDYVKGIFLKILGRMSLAYFLCGLVWYFCFMVYGIFSNGNIDWGFPFSDQRSFSEDLVSNLIYTILSPILIGYSFFLYEDVKIAKEGMVFAPSRGRKNKYLIFAILGFIYFLSVGSFIVVVSSFVPAS
ncbi:MAG: hypothetical protein ACJA02_000599 [Myxococcota bacterium]|jgi:hypothetical protein